MTYIHYCRLLILDPLEPILGYKLFFFFKLIHLRSIAKQVIPSYINHYRPLIPDGIHLFFLNEVWEDREVWPVHICWALSKEASGTVCIMSLVWRGRGSNPRPPAHGANALTTKPPLLGYTVVHDENRIVKWDIVDVHEHEK